MIRQGLGILGCVSLAAANLLALAVVFFEQAIIAAGIPYHALKCSVLAAALFGVVVVCGLNARETWTGQVALVGGMVLGLLFVGIISWGSRSPSMVEAAAEAGGAPDRRSRWIGVSRLLCGGGRWPCRSAANLFGGELTCVGPPNIRPIEAPNSSRYFNRRSYSRAQWPFSWPNKRRTISRVLLPPFVK
jgi:hypothetical protein